ncbi:MAG: GAF and ANTAR domain-containing protein [Microthrixaceae bacterium]
MNTSIDPPMEFPDAGPLAETFVELARSVTEGADTVEVFSMLSERCVRLLPVDACGILIVDNSGDLQVIGSSNSSVHLLDLFQLQNEEGPCVECCRTGEAVADTTLDDAALNESGRWPTFAAMTRAQGFRAVYALPLSSRGAVIGALNLFSTSLVGDDQLVVAQALADAATIALLQADPLLDAVTVARQLHLAVEARNTVEQAKGVLAERFDIDFDAAMHRLREVAHELDLRLIEVARTVVERDTDSPAASLLERPTDETT